MINKLILILLLTVAAFPQASVPRGQAREGLKMASSILGRDIPYAVYLPSDYALSTRRYPVVYSLHGYGDNESAWIQFGEVNLAADRAIAGRELPPMIIVMPAGGVTWFANDVRGRDRWEDMFIREFVPFIDRVYRTRPTRENRALSGLSMGGWGALSLALAHIDLFAAVAAFSPALWTEEDLAAHGGATYDYNYAALFGARPAGEGRLPDFFKARNPTSLAKTMPETELKELRIYIDCGDDDDQLKGSASLHEILRRRQIPSELRVRNGEHTWDYWRAGIVAGLAFLGRSFTQ